MVEVVERTDLAVVERLEAPCRELHAYHGSVSPTMGDLPLRGSDDLWERKRRAYEEWLAEDDGTFVLLAIEGEDLLGYAFVRSIKGYAGWASEERMGMLEALSVIPGHRGDGIGHLLMLNIADRLRDRGVGQLSVRLIHANTAAHEFYEKHQFVSVINEMFVRVDDIA